MDVRIFRRPARMPWQAGTWTDMTGPNAGERSGSTVGISQALAQMGSGIHGTSHRASDLRPS